MKRMYVTLGVILLLFVWAVSSFGQKKPLTQEEQLRKHLEMREEIQKRIRDKLLYGFGDEGDLFGDMDKLMDEAMKDSFLGMGDTSTFSLSSGSNSNFSMSWNDTSSGKRLSITPQSPEQKLDIDVNSNMVTIKGVAKTKSQNGVDAVASFTNSFSVPFGCDGSKVKMSQDGGKIVLDFPCSEKKVVEPTKPKDDRKPVGPIGGDVEI